MNKQDMYSILNENRINLFQKYCEAESSVDKRLTIKNDGVAYSGQNFIKFVPNEADRKNHYWSDVIIIYWGKKTSCGSMAFGMSEFILKRDAKTKIGQHIKSTFEVLGWVEGDVANHKKERAND